MAQFYGEVRGHRGEASRVGTKDSGLIVFAHGWNIGARVRCFVGHNDTDCVIVTLDGGTRGNAKETCLGQWANVNGVIVPLPGQILRYADVSYEKHESLFGTWRLVNGSLVLEEA